MKKLRSDKNVSFDIQISREKESVYENPKWQWMYVENPKKGMKNHSSSKRESLLLFSALYYVGNKSISCTIRVFFLKRETLLDRKSVV